MEKGENMRQKSSLMKTSNEMPLDPLTETMLDTLAGEEEKSRPEIIMAAVKLLFLKKRSIIELKQLMAKD
jgi:hypothetical protein